MIRNIWQLQEAKSKFSELVDRVLAEGVQIVTRRGRKAVVVLPYEDYERLTQRNDNLISFLMDSPLHGAELDINRQPDLPRDLEIES